MSLIPAADVPVDTPRSCSSVDYRLTGIVQPHAALLVLRTSDLQVMQASESVASVLGVAAHELIGTTPLADGRLTADDLAEVIDAAAPEPAVRIVGTLRTADGRVLAGRVHRLDQRLILELEPEHHPDDHGLGDPDRLRDDLIEIAASADSLDELLDEIVRRLRADLQVDRVEVCRFDADWHGEIVAECSDPELEPHLGIRFPSTDVPPSARAMLAEAPLRVTVDQSAEPSPLHPPRDPESDAHLDMTHVRCRAVGGQCRQFYRNMGVRSTLVIPIIVRSQLWGLISARHHQPRRLHPRLDGVLQSIARLVGLSISHFQAAARAHAERIAVDTHRMPHDIGPQDPDWLTTLTEHLETFRELLSADGLALAIGEDILVAGPLRFEASRLATLVAAMTSDAPSRSAASHRLRAEHPQLQLQAHEPAGALVVPLSSGPGDAVVWLRRDQTRTVAWAGRPENASCWEEAGQPDLRPRASFAAWQEVTRDTSAPWTEHELALAETVSVPLGIQLMSFRALQASRSKSQFLSNMSHELRTPLTAILGYADILQEQVSSPDAAASTRTIRRNGAHLLALINDILDLSKMEAGKLDVACEAVDLPLLLQDVIELLQVRADASDIGLKLQWDGPVPATVQTDPLRLRQILVNLVANAIKFTEEGQVRVSVRWTPVTPTTGEILIDVIDSGIGMTAEQAGRIFRPFEQADGSTSRTFGGTGLGLAISKRLAEHLGGTITVSSEPGRGSTFSLRFDAGAVDPARFIDPALARPRHETPKPDAATEDPPAHASLTGRRILLAEDGPDNQRLIDFHLKKAGARTVVVENGHLALEALQKARADGRPFDLVLMDMQMPILDGYAATRRLRDGGDRTPVIALTAHAMTGYRQRCLDAGCDDYTTKPIRRAALMATLAGWLDRTSDAAVGGACAGGDESGSRAAAA